MSVHAAGGSRFGVLDGWRGFSILLVLAAHLLPLGPKALQFNEAVAILGMVLFFTLSGFLITGFLIEHDNVTDFLVRRFFRIVPLAWTYLAVALLFAGAAVSAYPAHFLFYANLPPFWLTDVTGHFWSLCVEVQFYLAVALLFIAAGERGLLLLVPLCLAVTAWRAATGTPVSIVTWLRVDEILAGCIVALVWFGRLGTAPRRWLGRLSPWLLMPLLAVACHRDGGFMNYLRPYLAAALVGSTLDRRQGRLVTVLQSRQLRYIADISYALYVVHPLLGATWLGSGAVLEKYLKRPLLLAAIFGVAHVSTFAFERRFTAFGKRLGARLGRPRVATDA